MHYTLSHGADMGDVSVFPELFPKNSFCHNARVLYRIAFAVAKEVAMRFLRCFG